MVQNALIEPETEPAVPTATSYYLERCLECPEILTEAYGCRTPLRCVECVASDLSGKRSAII